MRSLLHCSPPNPLLSPSNSSASLPPINGPSSIPSLPLTHCIPSSPSHPTRPHSPSPRHTTTPSADTRGCGGSGGPPGTAGVWCRPPRLSGRGSLRIHHTAGRPTHTGHWSSGTGLSRTAAELPGRNGVNIASVCF